MRDLRKELIEEIEKGTAVEDLKKCVYDEAMDIADCGIITLDKKGGFKGIDQITIFKYKNRYFAIEFYWEKYWTVEPEIVLEKIYEVEQYKDGNEEIKYRSKGEN